MVSDKQFLWEFPIGSYVKLSSAVAAILVGGLKCWTQIWKGATQETFHQSLDAAILNGGQGCRKQFCKEPTQRPSLPGLV